MGTYVVDGTAQGCHATGLMPHYYFHLHNDLDVDDLEGTELPDLTSARARATEYAREMAALSVVEQGKVDLRHSIQVQDKSGAVLLTVTFGDAMTVLGHTN